MSRIDKIIKDKQSPSIQPKVDIDSDKYKQFISKEFGYATGLIKTEAGFKLHDAQLAFLREPGDAIANKARQIGLSTELAMEATARINLMNKDWTIVITSIKKEEAQNKIGYISAFLDNIPMAYRRKIKYSTKQSIEVENSDGTTGKIISHAQKESRGLHGDQYYDEADFYNDFKRILEAGMPGTRTVGGRTRIVSTPYDPRGHFRRMIDPIGYFGTQDHPNEYPGFKKFKFTWWIVPFYTNDLAKEIVKSPRTGRNIIRAAVEAPLMTTEARVLKFGNPLLIESFQNTSIEAFQREYEATFNEKSFNYFKPREILSCVVRDIDEIYHEDFSLHWNENNIADDTGKVELNSIESVLIENGITPQLYGNPGDEDSIEELYEALYSGKITSNLFMGIDVGATNHATDIWIVEDVSIKGISFLIPRFWINKQKWKLPLQQDYIEKKILDRVPIIKFGIDTNGLGHQLGEYFDDKFGDQFISFSFGKAVNWNKAMAALSSRIQSRTMGIENYRELLDSFDGVRRTITPDGNNKWKLREDSHGHADGVISRGIGAALANQYTNFTVGHNINDSLTMTDAPSKNDIFVDPFGVFEKPTVYNSLSGNDRLLSELTPSDILSGIKINEYI